MPAQRRRPFLTRYELCRLIGVRALCLSEGEPSAVRLDDHALQRDATYVAAYELYHGLLDACVMRDGKPVHVNEFVFPDELVVLLNTRDGGRRTAVCARAPAACVQKNLAP